MRGSKKTHSDQQHQNHRTTDGINRGNGGRRNDNVMITTNTLRSFNFSVTKRGCSVEEPDNYKKRSRPNFGMSSGPDEAQPNEEHNKEVEKLKRDNFSITSESNEAVIDKSGFDLKESLTNGNAVNSIKDLNNKNTAFLRKVVDEEIYSSLKIGKKLLTENFVTPTDGESNLDEQVPLDKDEDIPLQEVEFMSSKLLTALKEPTYLEFPGELHGFSLEELRHAVIPNAIYKEFLNLFKDICLNKLDGIGETNTEISTTGLFQTQLLYQDPLLLLLPYLKFNFHNYQTEPPHVFHHALSLLNNFNCNPRFGPKLGVTPLERYDRAQKNGALLSPKVKKLLLSQQYRNLGL